MTIDNHSHTDRQEFIEFCVRYKLAIKKNDRLNSTELLTHYFPTSRKTLNTYLNGEGKIPKWVKKLMLIHDGECTRLCDLAKAKSHIGTEEEQIVLI